MRSRPLRTVLAPEGGSDVRYLSTLLGRVLEDLAGGSNSVVTVAPVRDLRNVEGYGRTLESTARSIENLRGVVEIAFVHADGGKDPAAARRNFIEPLRGRTGVELVAVVPVKETEAWALADGPALKRVLGEVDPTLLADRPATVETINDPKRYLADVWASTSSRRTNGGFPFERLAEEQSLQTLKSVPAFRRLRHEVEAALVLLGFLDEGQRRFA